MAPGASVPSMLGMERAAMLVAAPFMAPCVFPARCHGLATRLSQRSPAPHSEPRHSQPRQVQQQIEKVNQAFVFQTFQQRSGPSQRVHSQLKSIISFIVIRLTIEL